MSKKSLLFFALIILSAIIVYFYSLESKVILQEPLTAWEKDHFSDCAIVLTGGPGRVREGFDMLAQGNARKLIISGVYPGAQLREIFPQWPFYGSLKKNDVILEKRSGTTYGNALQTLPLVEALNCRDITLITSKLHMYRAFQIYKNVYPKNFLIHKRSVIGHSMEPNFWRLYFETTKSLFYSLWAY